MGIWLAYQIALGVGLVIALAWAFDARRTFQRIVRLVEMHDGPPTEELELPPTMRIGGMKLEDFGPGKPVPPRW